MKRLFIICGLLFSVITFAQAQGGRMTPEERAQKTTDMLTQKLKLNDDQKAKVLAIYTDQGTQMAKVREDHKGDQEAMKAASTKIMAESDTKINALLTDDQKKEYATWKEQRKSMMQKRSGGGGQTIPATPMTQGN